MIVKYSYLTREFKDFGEYQCEVEDFKKFFRSRRDTIIECLVRFSDGQIWLWRSYWYFICSGWFCVKRERFQSFPSMVSSSFVIL